MSAHVAPVIRGPMSARKVVSTRYRNDQHAAHDGGYSRLEHLSLHDAGTADDRCVRCPPGPNDYSAVHPRVLATQLPIREAHGPDKAVPVPRPLHDAAGGGEDQGLTFVKEDLNDATDNRVLWEARWRTLSEHALGPDFGRNRQSC